MRGHIVAAGCTLLVYQDRTLCWHALLQKQQHGLQQYSLPDWPDWQALIELCITVGPTLPCRSYSMIMNE
jgi:hypothetical protein